MTKEKKPTIHLYIISILVLIFFLLAYLPLSMGSVEVQYTFEDNITLSSLDNIEYTSVGNLFVKNNGFLPTKVKLKRFVLCTFIPDDYNYQNSIELSYRGDTSRTWNTPSGNYIDYVELSPKDTLSLDITPSYNYYVKNSESKLQSSVEFEGYIYELELDEDYIYNFCSNVKKEDANYIVKIILDLKDE